MKLILLIALAVFMTASVSAAEETRDPVFLTEDTALEFEPVSATFFVRFMPSNALVPIPATIAKRRTGDHWIAGAKITLPVDASALQYSVLIRGKFGQAAQLPPRSLSLDGPPNSVDALREKLLQRKGVLKSYEVQLQSQEAALDRLRADADAIADLARIVEVKDELNRLEAASKALDQDIENLQLFVRLVRNQPAPQSAVGREAQLTKQLAVLADAAHNAEVGEGGRRSESQEEFESRMALIEETRYEDLDALQRELVRLRQDRLELERKLGVAEPETPEEYLR